MSKDYYNILGIDKNASKDEIKRAFRKKAHKYHPDKDGGDEEKFKEANEAYQVLKDDKKRQTYDQFGSDAFSGGGPGGFGGGQGFGGFDFSGFQGSHDFGDIFGDIFGGGSRRSRERRGSDIQVDIDLDFLEAVFGVEKEISLTKTSNCERCAGNGAEPGSGMETCSECSGHGIVTKAHRTILGTMQSKVTCEKCQGSGDTPKKSCTTCHGGGVEMKKQTSTVSIPAGVDHGNTLRIREEGEAIRGGKNGDLFVRLHVRADKRFDREGFHIYSEAKIGFTQAALGTKVDVETVDGKVELDIPHGTQSGSVFRLKGKGVPSRRGRGDHYVTATVLTPKKLSRKEKKLLEELDLNE
jgi:molecular chaperone DnaJ